MSDTKAINVIGVSEDQGLRSDEDTSLSTIERLFEADDHEPTGPEVGVSVITCRQTSPGRAACTVVLNLNGLGGYRRGQVVAEGNLPFEGGNLSSGTLRIIGGNACDPKLGRTLIVEIWNPKKYSQSEP